MKNLRLFVALAVLCPATAFAQSVTVTAPASAVTIKPVDDFATRAFQDPWDMNQKTDVGPFLGSNDAGSNGWANGFTFSGGLFSGTTTASDAQLWFLDTGNPNAVPIGKTGTNYPIDANFYKVFAVRMTVQSSTQAQVLTWPQTIYNSSPTAHASGFVSAGTGVYFINLDLTSPAGGNANWNGLQRALRFQPTGLSGQAVTVDWARLVPAGVSGTSCQVIQWTGAVDADIYLDTDLDTTNGFYGLAQSFASQTNGAATRASAGCPVVANAFNFYVGALPAGTYRVFVVPVGATPTAATGRYSPGTWTVGDIPTLTFITPTSEGSSDDFAASQLGDAWDMDKLTDIDSMVNVDNPVITTLNVELPSGTAVPGQRVFQGTSSAAPGGCAAAAGDPQLTLLSQLKRGLNTLIDTDRYRLLTVEFGIPNAPRDVNCGSVARIIWRQKGDLGSGSVSDDIIFNQRAGVNLLDKFTLDLKTTFVEQGTNAGGTNWTNGAGGGVEIFRFDPHEFDQPTPFFIKRIKLADFERAKTSYLITWSYSKSVGSVDLFYDLDATGFNGTMIAQDVNATSGQFAWTLPPGLATAPGTPIYIYAVFRDVASPICAPATTTCSTNQVYAPLPIIADSAFANRPRAVLSRRTLNFGVQGNSTTTTAPQTTRLTFVGAADATPCWTISNTNLNFTVTPSSGVGNATLTVALVPQSFPGGGTGVATFTVNEGASCAGRMLNPGQQFTATFRIASSGTPPSGAVDTPADNATGIVGSLGVTGWVVDDIDVASVNIYRNAVSGENPDGLGRIFLGTASRVDDARPDIEAAFPTNPFNYRGGWGYLLLTNFLPNLGNGTFLLSVYATDVDGHEALLGQRTITVTNAIATEPFGAIDTPAQGGTATGNLNNFGWVLSRAPFRADPPGGGSVVVVVDGAVIGSPGQWTTRSDLQALFPATEYPGIGTALGVFTFNTATLTDGVHTIAWVVTANNGQAAGIGSRYFTSVNGNGLVLTDPNANVFSAAAPVNPYVNLGRAANEVARLDRTAAVRTASGSTIRATSSPIAADATGLRTIYGRSLERVVVDASAPGGRKYEAYLVADGTLRPLPIGASFDDTRGVLYWQPGLAFTGAYDFVVVRDGAARVPVRIVLAPGASRKPVDRMVRNLFTATN